jgi:hypothetical protein
VVGEDEIRDGDRGNEMGEVVHRGKTVANHVLVGRSKR